METSQIRRWPRLLCTRVSPVTFVALAVLNFTGCLLNTATVAPYPTTENTRYKIYLTYGNAAATSEIHLDFSPGSEFEFSALAVADSPETLANYQADVEDASLALSRDQEVVYQTVSPRLFASQVSESTSLNSKYVYRATCPRFHNGLEITPTNFPEAYRSEGCPPGEAYFTRQLVQHFPGVFLASVQLRIPPTAQARAQLVLIPQAGGNDSEYRTPLTDGYAFPLRPLASTAELYAELDRLEAYLRRYPEYFADHRPPSFGFPDFGTLLQSEYFRSIPLRIFLESHPFPRKFLGLPDAVAILRHFQSDLGRGLVSNLLIGRVITPDLTLPHAYLDLVQALTPAFDYPQGGFGPGELADRWLE